MTSALRNLRLRHFACACALPAALLAASPALAQSGGSATHGYYTTAQANAGQATFAQVCAICHGDHLQGNVGPALSGHMFLSVSQFQGVTVGYLYQFMSTHMPQTAPGSLTQTQYLDLMAYILMVNGYPAGSDPLSADQSRLKTIKLEPQTPNPAAAQKKP